MSKYTYKSNIERTLYKDDGCKFYPSCLQCPFPKCQYEEKLPRVLFLGWVRKWRINGKPNRDCQVNAQGEK